MLRRRLTFDYILTFASEFMVLLAGLLVYKLAASAIGENGFTDYALSRRTLSFIQPLLVIGLGVGIPRYIAFAMAKGVAAKPGSYFISGLIIVSLITLPVLLLLIVFRNFFSQLLFDTDHFAALMPQLALMLCGLILHSVVYAFYRGSVRMIQANLLQLLNLGLVPMLAFLFRDSLGQVLLATGIGWTAVAAVFLLLLLPRLDWERSELRGCIRELFVYGAQRMPGDVALAGFLALPAYFTAHVVDDQLKTAGYVAFSMSMLNLAGAAFGPICLLLLPSASEAIVAKDFARLKRQTNRVAAWTLGLTAFGILVAELFAEPIIAIYLGQSSEGLVNCLRIVIPASIGYTIYISLRSILDAYYVKAVNTFNIFIAFLLFLVVATVTYFMQQEYTMLLYGFIAAMILLGLLTARETYRIFRKEK